MDQNVAGDANSSRIVANRSEPYLWCMHTTLWATLSANGNYARSTPDHPPRPEALADFAVHVRETGNFIVGRRTFEEFQAQPSRGGAQPFAGIDIVVVSSQPLEAPGVTRVTSPADALAHLARKGHRRALLAGGEALHNAFLAADLVDDVIFNVAPVFERTGFHLVLSRTRDVRLTSVRELGGGVAQLRYALR